MAATQASMLAACNELIEDLLTQKIQRGSVGGKEYTLRNLDELRRLRDSLTSGTASGSAGFRVSPLKGASPQ